MTRYELARLESERDEAVELIKDLDLRITKLRMEMEASGYNSDDCNPIDWIPPDEESPDA